MTTWTCECADAVEFLQRQADDSIDLLFTSPPYERARSYGIGDRMVSGQAWVDWMVGIVAAAAPKVKGLIAINCEGQTRGFAYSAVPFLLMADLHRAGFNLRKPVVFHRVGIPGSGGPDWLRNDWEPILCITRKGKLPWSDNTACGEPPKCAPGGAMSHRHADGQRLNAKRSQMKQLVGSNGIKKMYSRNPDCTRDEEEYYIPPEVANPGNVLSVNVGGGVMGHALTHDNEAPFPLELATFFVKTFAPPGGVVCDPFSGSGTTCHAAIENGRHFIGCDIRESQVDLCRRRMETVTPALPGFFDGVDAGLPLSHPKPCETDLGVQSLFPDTEPESSSLLSDAGTPSAS